MAGEVPSEWPKKAMVFVGSYVRMPRLGEVVLTSKEAVVVVDRETGRIVCAKDKGEPGYEAALGCGGPRTVLSKTQVLMPGMVDGHAHAPQHAFAGNGLDLPLLDWLETYTFPAESKFADVAYAKETYEAAVKRHLRNGTTCVSYFGTIHVPGTLALVDACRDLGQRAHVGKVSMDANAPAYYIEANAATAAADAEAFVDAVLDGQDATGATAPLVTPSVIPRFAPSCSAELLAKLGALSTRGGKKLPVHTHLSENKAECAWVKSLFPEADGYGDVYARAGLLHERSYFAHCCHCDKAERSSLIVAKGGVVTCPTSNFVVGRALCDVRTWLDEGAKVGVGTDVAGGWSTSMLVALRHVVVASRLVAERDNDLRKALTWREALYLSTAGGAEVLGIDSGLIEAGRPFDALLVELDDPTGAYDPGLLPTDGNLGDLFEKFLWNGDDRNILDVYVDGRRVSGARSAPTFFASSKFKTIASLALGCAGVALLFARRSTAKA